MGKPLLKSMPESAAEAMIHEVMRMQACKSAPAQHARPSQHRSMPHVALACGAGADVDMPCGTMGMYGAGPASSSEVPRSASIGTGWLRMPGMLPRPLHAHGMAAVGQRRQQQCDGVPGMLPRALRAVCAVAPSDPCMQCMPPARHPLAAAHAVLQAVFAARTCLPAS